MLCLISVTHFRFDNADSLGLIQETFVWYLFQKMLETFVFSQSLFLDPGTGCLKGFVKVGRNSDWLSSTCCLVQIINIEADSTMTYQFWFDKFCNSNRLCDRSTSHLLVKWLAWVTILIYSRAHPHWNLCELQPKNIFWAFFMNLTQFYPFFFKFDMIFGLFF